MAAKQLALTIAARAGRGRGARRGADAASDGSVVVNELAMRPHNTGHWTIDGPHTSPVREPSPGRLDLPLGDPTPRAPWTVMVNVLGGRLTICRGAAALLRAGPPAAGAACTARGPARVARSVTSRPSATTLTTSASGPGTRPLSDGRPRCLRPGRGWAIVMGSDSDWPVMEAAAEALRGVRRGVRGRRGLGAPDARGDGRLRPGGTRARPRGDHRRGRWSRPPAGNVGRPDAAAGHRRTGAAEVPGRDGLAALDRADAGRRTGGHRARSATPATPACSPYGSWPPGTPS